jgi:large-conductance mechanosensitive channel
MRGDRRGYVIIGALIALAAGLVAGSAFGDLIRGIGR